MSEVSPTPGSWTAVGPRVLAPDPEGYQPQQVAECWRHAAGGFMCPDIAEAEANARLMAASKKMLESLWIIARSLEYAGVGSDTKRAWNAALHALSAATGRSVDQIAAETEQWVRDYAKPVYGKAKAVAQ